ncbi:hypothetical protein B0H63DRAFT_112252 [Podospora didyma]|uniref:Uncharacterized protein n=1 Tax=Podospora didyma TaxID=330526 RepID=A0AAE0U4I3_9PEZI|nr:hypothetical protein B0H63DRAFT_112252 [Podospora didyma]
MPTMWDRLKTTPKVVDDSGVRVGGFNKKGYSYEIQGGPPPTRMPRVIVQPQIETAPAVQEPPPRNPSRLAVRTNIRPSSVVYTQFSAPAAAPAAAQYTAASYQYPANLATKYIHRYQADEISPPSSPEPDSAGGYRYQADDVSPIDDDPPDMSQQFEPSSSRNARGNRLSVQEPPRHSPSPSPSPSPQNRAATNIPMMRRARRQQSDAALRDALVKDRPVAQQKTQLPTQQQQPLHHQQQSYSQDPLAGQDGPKWDPLTGERTTNSNGRPSQVKPAAFAHSLGMTGQTSAPSQKSPSAMVTSFGDRVRRMAKKAGGRETDIDPAAGAFTSSRPGWRGASGRNPIVDPVRDNPEVAPLRIPDKSSKRVMSPTFAPGPKPGPGMGGAQKRGQTLPVSPPGSETATSAGPRGATIRKIASSSQHSPPPMTKPQSQENRNYPSPPLSGTLVGGDAPSLAAKELAHDGLANLSTLSPSSPMSPTFNAGLHEKNVIRRKPPPAHANHHHQDSVSSIYSQPSEVPPNPPLHNPNANSLAPAPVTDTWVQPPSRFSVTTYATSATGTSRESFDDQDHERPPMPALPPGLRDNSLVEQNENLKMGGPYDHAKVYSSGNSPVVASPQDMFPSPFHAESQASRDRKAERKPLALHNPSIARAKGIDRPDSRASSINKVLPPPPEETTAGETQDRVGMLSSQLKALANRRININRSIEQMTKLMPTDNLMNSDAVVRKREVEKQTVKRLKEELSEVQREEYELGLKLHRAYKRLDRDADWEPTTLWVRRVTD